MKKSIFILLFFILIFLFSSFSYADEIEDISSTIEDELTDFKNALPEEIVNFLPKETLDGDFSTLLEGINEKNNQLRNSKSFFHLYLPKE